MMYCHPNDYFADRKRETPDNRKQVIIMKQFYKVTIPNMVRNLNEFGMALNKSFRHFKKLR